MEGFSLHSVDPNRHTLTLFSSIGGGFSRAEGDGIRTLQDLLRTIQPLRLGLYDGPDLRDHSRVGEGASYRVFRSTYRKGPKTVAVKQVKLPLDSSQHDVFRKRVCCVLKDVEIMHHGPLAHHKNILTLLGYGWGLSDESALPYLVTEYSANGTLRQFLKARSLRMQSRLKLCGDVASGLHAMHLSCVSHGDLKLENILVFEGPSHYNDHQEPEFIAKLSDFGHSCVFSPDQANGSVQSYRGTTGYLAPELYHANSTTVDFRKCDVWSLALLLWETLLGGSRYSEDSKIQELREQIDSNSQSTRMASEDQKGGNGASNNGQSYANLWISEQLAPIAISFADTTLRPQLSDLERGFVKGIFRTSLQVDPERRCGDVSKLPFVYSKHSSDQSHQLSMQSVEDGKWSYEAFTPQSIVSIPNKAKVQILADAKHAALHPASTTGGTSAPALYVGLAYATGFGVERDMDEFRSWTIRSAQTGSTAAKLILQVLDQTEEIPETVLNSLSLSWEGTENRSRQSSCQFHDQSHDAWSIQSFSSTDRCNPLHYLPIFERLDHYSITSTGLRASKIVKRKSFKSPVKEGGKRARNLDKIVRYFGPDAMKECVLKTHYLHAQFPLSLCGSPLSFAITLSCLEAVTSLLRRGADPLENPLREPTQSLRVLPPLHVAVSCLQTDMFKVLWSTCRAQKSAQELRRRFIDDKDGSLLISSLARRSVLEREILHGSNRQSAEKQIIKEVTETLQSLACPTQSDGSQEKSSSPDTACTLRRIFSDGIQETLKLGDCEISAELIAQMPSKALSDSESMSMRKEIIRTAINMACGGVFDTKQSTKFLHFARDVGSDLNPDLQILRAIMEYQNEALFMNLVNQSVSVNGLDDTGQSPLHHMLSSGFYTLVPIKELLGCGADVNCPDAQGRTPLQLAATRGLHVEVKEILAKGANPCAVDNAGNTALTSAVLSGNGKVLSEIITALLAQQTPGQQDYVRSINLLAYGTPCLANQRYRKTALHLAAQKQDAKAIEILLAHGAPVDIPDEESNLPLHLAIGSNDCDLADVLFCCYSLLDAGSPIDSLNQSGLSAVHLAATNWVGDGLEAILSCFLGRQEGVLDTKDSSGKSALHHVASTAKESSVRILLRLGASPNCSDFDGLTALHVCAQASYGSMKESVTGRAGRLKRLAALLLTSGDAINTRDHEGYAAIDYAVINGSGTLFDFFLGKYQEQLNSSIPVSRASYSQMLSHVWTLSIQGKHWTIVKRLLRLTSDFEADMSILSWPTGAHLFRYAVETSDEELLRQFCPSLTGVFESYSLALKQNAVPSHKIPTHANRPKFLYQTTPSGQLLIQLHAMFPEVPRSRLQARIRETAHEHLVRFFPPALTELHSLQCTLQNRDLQLDRGWLPDEIQYFESYVKANIDLNGGEVLHGIYVYLASWDAHLIKMYFQVDYCFRAERFLHGWLDVEDVKPKVLLRPPQSRLGGKFLGLFGYYDDDYVVVGKR